MLGRVADFSSGHRRQGQMGRVRQLPQSQTPVIIYCHVVSSNSQCQPTAQYVLDSDWSRDCRRCHPNKFAVIRVQSIAQR